jgi:hypothetical protein
MLLDMTEDETAELAKTASEFAKQLKAIDKGCYEGGEESKSPDKKPKKENDMLSLKSPSMITKKERSPRGGISNFGPSQVSAEKNPFQFIEAALIEAKQKIEKMKATPQILESLTDVSRRLSYR